MPRDPMLNAHPILLVEDDVAIATVIIAALEDEGFTIAHCTNIAARDRQVAALERQLATDNDTLSLAAERYRLRLDDVGSVIDAQRTAYATREALAAARGLARDQRIVLYRAIGGSAAGTEGEVVVAQ